MEYMEIYETKTEDYVCGRSNKDCCLLLKSSILCIFFIGI